MCLLWKSKSATLILQRHLFIMRLTQWQNVDSYTLFCNWSGPNILHVYSVCGVRVVHRGQYIDREQCWSSDNKIIIIRSSNWWRDNRPRGQFVAIVRRRISGMAVFLSRASVFSRTHDIDMEFLSVRLSVCLYVRYCVQTLNCCNVRSPRLVRQRRPWCLISYLVGIYSLWFFMVHRRQVCHFHATPCTLAPQPKVGEVETVRTLFGHISRMKGTGTRLVEIACLVLGTVDGDWTRGRHHGLVSLYTSRDCSINDGQRWRRWRKITIPNDPHGPRERERERAHVLQLTSEPVKLVYDPDQPDGGLTLTASAFNQLAALVVAGHTATQNSPFSSVP